MPKKRTPSLRGSFLTVQSSLKDRAAIVQHLKSENQTKKT